MRNYGLQEVLESVQDYILGSSPTPFIPYNPSGNWEPFLPAFERQNVGFETFCCTIFGTLNVIETLYKFLYGVEPNYSERFVAIISKLTGSGGTDPQIPAEAVRHEGLVNQSVLPMTDSKEEFFNADSLTGSIRAKGQNWLVQHDFKHEWLWKTGQRPENYIEVLREALQTSPIGVSVSAWNEVNGEYVSNQGSVNNHWCLLYKIDDEGHPWIFDSYDNSKKKLSKDHNIRRAKRIWINVRTRKASKTHVTLLTKILNMLLNRKTLLGVAESYLGKDASPNNQAVSELACAESITFLLKQVYPETPIITGTYSLYDFLRKPTSNFIQLKEPVAGCIALAVTGMGKKGTNGHAWIVFEDGTWGSNNSYGIYRGLFTKNYTYQTAKKRYTDEQGMEIFFFNHV